LDNIVLIQPYMLKKASARRLLFFFHIILPKKLNIFLTFSLLIFKAIVWSLLYWKCC